MSTEIRGAATKNHQKMLEALAEFGGFDAIEYHNLGNGEDYILTKGDKTITLKVRGNQFDGGFMTVDYGQPPVRSQRSFS